MAYNARQPCPLLKQTVALGPFPGLPVVPQHVVVEHARISTTKKPPQRAALAGYERVDDCPAQRTAASPGGVGIGLVTSGQVRIVVVLDSEAAHDVCALPSCVSRHSPSAQKEFRQKIVQQITPFETNSDTQCAHRLDHWDVRECGLRPGTNRRFMDSASAMPGCSR